MAFARAQHTLRCGCYKLVFDWMRANGVRAVPPDGVARRAWFRHGAAEGAKLVASGIGVFERETMHCGDVVLFHQPGGDALLGIAMQGGAVVVRSFGILAAMRPQSVLAIWGFGCE